jgi:hypothetical protein
MSRNYSVADLVKARNSISAVNDQYSDCRDVIDRAIVIARRASNKRTQGGSKKGQQEAERRGLFGLDPPVSSPVTPAERAEVDRITKTPPGKVRAGDKELDLSGTAAPSPSNRLPTSLLFLLGSLLTTALIAAIAFVRRNYPNVFAGLKRRWNRR